MPRSTATAGFSFTSGAMPGLEKTVVASVSGSVDYGNAAALRRDLLRVLSSGTTDGLVIELSAVKSLDTAAAAVLVEILMEGRRREIQVFLCGASLTVRRLFQLSGLNEALECCCDSPAEVKQRLSGQSRT